MAELGYAVVSRDDNPLGTYCCSEYLFMRVEARRPTHVHARRR